MLPYPAWALTPVQGYLPCGHPSAPALGHHDFPHAYGSVTELLGMVSLIGLGLCLGSFVYWLDFFGVLFMFSEYWFYLSKSGGDSTFFSVTGED